jgi:acyl-CoA-binding protein
MDIEKKFLEAVEESRTLTEKPSNETLLKLYSLYKQATLGDNISEPNPNPFDFVAKAKYDAWADLFGKPKEVAMQEYIDLIYKLKN